MNPEVEVAGEIVAYVFSLNVGNPPLQHDSGIGNAKNCRICPFRRADDADPICNSEMMVLNK